MSNVRTIRLLDRERGKPTESREVAGIVVEKGVPLPEPRTTGLMDALRALEVGESFLYHCHIKDRANRVPGRKFACRKRPDGQWRVWRTA